MKILHFYTMVDEPERVRDVAPLHAAYWREAAVEGYVGGPFADRSGGLVTFEVASEEQAQRLIAGDPFVREGLLQTSYVREWLVSSPTGPM